MYRIDPHEHPIGRQELLAHLAGEFLVVHRRLGMDADSGKLLENPEKAIVLWGGGSPSLGIAGRMAILWGFGLELRPCMRHSSLGEWRRAWTGRLTGCLLDPVVITYPLLARLTILR